MPESETAGSDSLCVHLRRLRPVAVGWALHAMLGLLHFMQGAPSGIKFHQNTWPLIAAWKLGNPSVYD